jgi:hypothetical protein
MIQQSIGTLVAAIATPLLLASGAVHAQDEILPTPSPDWVLLTETRTTAIRVDTTRIIPSGDYTGVWFLLQRRRELRDASGRDLRGAAFFEELDCSNLVSRRWEIHALGPRGDVIEKHVSNGSGWVPFRSHPVGEAAMLAGCEFLARRKP